MNIFELADYKAILRTLIEKKSQEGQRVNLTRLAAACRIQKTYLSKVLNHDGHLNSDQLHLACKYLGLKSQESKYIFLLHESERSDLIERKEALRREARKLQAKALSTENYISAEPVTHEESDLLRYHLDPLLQLVHLFLTVPRFAKSHKLIGDELRLKKDQLDLYLEALVKMKLVIREGNGWKVIRDSLHLSREADAYQPYRIMLRTMALEKLQRSRDDNDYSFSVFFSADESSRRLIQERFMEFLKTIQPIVKKAQAENVYQINFDLLGWS